MKPVRKFLLAFTLGIIAVGGFAALSQTIRIFEFGKKADYTIRPFTRSNPAAKLRVLFLGDSTMVGTGARVNTESTAGWFGREFPNAHIDNLSINGLKLEGLLKRFHPAAGVYYDLVIAQIGANDIIHGTSMPVIKEDINRLIDRLKPIAGTVVILHSGHIGLAPIFVWPADEILGRRSRQVRAIYMQAAKERGVLYADLYADRANDLFLKDIDLYYSPDRFHPSGEGYHHWYQLIRQTLDAAGVRLRD